MRVRMNTVMAGPAGIVFPGQVLDVALSLARDLVAGRYAVALDELPKPPEPKQTQPHRSK